MSGWVAIKFWTKRKDQYEMSDERGLIRRTDQSNTEAAHDALGQCQLPYLRREAGKDQAERKQSLGNHKSN